jgi:hypothetical protein
MKKTIALLLIMHLTTTSSELVSRLVRTHFVVYGNPMRTAKENLRTFLKQQYPGRLDFGCWFLAIDNQLSEGEIVSITAPKSTPFANLLEQLPEVKFSDETDQPILSVTVPAKSTRVITCAIDPLYKGSQKISVLPADGIDNGQGFLLPPNHNDRLLIYSIHNQA